MYYYYLIPLVFVIGIFAFITYLKRPSTRGKRGENKVRSIIGNTIEGEQYVINDLIIEENGKSSQIDHIVINSHGIFVIETKNYSGEIYGSENQREWTQVLAYGKVKNKFYNPLKQNATHAYKVRSIVGDLRIYSLVVFVQNNIYHIEANNVIALSELELALCSGEPVLTIDQMKSAYESLLTSGSDISTKEHVDNIRIQQWNIELGICPRCGGKLVLRNGKYGDFWGCSNYPKCKFIKKDN